jgi:hypothetical protein
MLTDFFRRLVHALHEVVYGSVVELAYDFKYDEAPSTNWCAWLVKALVQPTMKVNDRANFRHNGRTCSRLHLRVSLWASQLELGIGRKELTIVGCLLPGP